MAMWARILIYAAGILLSTAMVADNPLQFSDWSAVANLGQVVNSTAQDGGSFISRDGLSLYFASNRPGGFGELDIWIAQRASIRDPWKPPKNLGPTINTSSTESTPTLSPDGQSLYFGSNRPGGLGGEDLWVSQRQDKRDDFNWQSPVSLGSGVNSAANEFSAARFDDNKTGTITLYFTSNRPGGTGSYDIYASTLNKDKTFGAAVVVAELSSPASDSRPGIRQDGLEILFDSNRPGTLGGMDIWRSTRSSTSNLWSPPVNLGSVVNSTSNDVTPRLSFDGTVLYFSSNRPGGFGLIDVYQGMRTRLKIDPSLAKSYMDRGLARLEEGNAADADRDFQKCLARIPR